MWACAQPPALDDANFPVLMSPSKQPPAASNGNGHAANGNGHAAVGNGHAASGNGHAANGNGNAASDEPDSDGSTDGGMGSAPAPATPTRRHSVSATRALAKADTRVFEPSMVSGHITS